MAALNQNFNIFESDDVGVQFTTTTTAGAAYDLTNATINWNLSLRPGSTPLIEKSTSNSGQITVKSPATDGIFTVNLIGTDTNGMAGRYYHEAQVIDSSGTARVVASGEAYIATSNIS